MNFCRLPNYLFLVAIWSLVASSNALAKAIEMKWSTVKGAEKYVLEVLKNGKPVLTKKINETKYLTDLDPGSYSYRMRAEDKFGREGRWSGFKDLIVTAPPPKVEVSHTPEKLEYAGVFPGLPIKWKKTDFADAYEVDVKNKKTGEIVFKKETLGTELKIENLPSGEFEYVVSSLIEVKGKKFSSKGVKGQALVIAKEKLETPKNLQPENNVIVSDDATATIEWNPVKGAQRYEVTFEPLDQRGIASAEKTKTWIITKTQMELPVDAKKKYRWKVRALAGTSESSESASSVFQTETDDTVEERVGSIQIGANSAQMNGSMSGPSNGGAGSAQGIGIGFEARADYWLNQKIGFEALYERLNFSSMSGVFGLSHGGVMAKTRWKFRNSPEAWGFFAKAGYGASEYLMKGSSNSQPALSTGLLLELGMQKSISDDFDLEFGVQHYSPVQMLNGANIVNFWGNRTARVYTRLNHALNKNLYASLGIRMDFRNLNTGSSLNADNFSSSGFAVDVSMKYKFGDVNDVKISDLLGAGFRKLANISTSDNDPLKPNHGVLEVVSGVMPFNSSSTQGSFTSSGNGVSFRNGIRGEYWPWQHGGFSLDYSQSYFQVGTSEKLGQDIAVNYGRRFFFDGFLGGSILIAKLGVASKSWIKLYSNNTADILTQPGPTFDLEFRKLFGKTMLSLSGQYQYPQVYTGKVKIFHPIYNSLEFGVEGFYENQLLKYYSDVFTQKLNYGVLGVLRYRFGVTY